MCNQLYLSTTSEEDLSKLVPKHARFLALDHDTDPEVVKALKHPNKWYVRTTLSPCSCHFYRLIWDDPRFGPEEEWLNFDREFVEATLRLYEVVTRLIGEGHRVETIDTWTDDVSDLEDLNVSIQAVPSAHFRLFENYRFEYCP